MFAERLPVALRACSLVLRVCQMFEVMAARLTRVFIDRHDTSIISPEPDAGSARPVYSKDVFPRELVVAGQ